MRSHRDRGATLPRQWSPRPASKTENRSVTWFHPLWRHGVQRPDFQIERGGVSQTGTWLLRSDNGPVSDEIIPGARQLVRDRRERYTRSDECFPARFRSGVATFPARSIKKHAGWTPIVPVSRHTMRATDGLQTTITLGVNYDGQVQGQRALIGNLGNL